MVADPEVSCLFTNSAVCLLFGGGIGTGGGGGGKVGPGEMDKMGESSSVNKSRMLSSREGSSVVVRSLEKPEATSSSC